MAKPKEKEGWWETAGEEILAFVFASDTLPEVLGTQGDFILSMLPLIVMIGMIFFVMSLLGVGVDGEFGYNLRRYWWVFALVGLPILLMTMGFDLGVLIPMLVVFTIAGGLFFWWMENDFELPKGDPIKDVFKWLRENTRW